MKRLKKVLKYYPDKSQRPTVRGVILGAAFDFGWAVSLIAIGALITIYRSPDYLYFELMRGGLILFAALVLKLLLVEAAIWWIYYLLKKNKT